MAEKSQEMIDAEIKTAEATHSECKGVRGVIEEGMKLQEMKYVVGHIVKRGS